MSLDGESTGPIDFSELHRQHEESMQNMRAALDSLRDMVASYQPFSVRRGGIQYPNGPIPTASKHDARKGEEVEVGDLLPGARVYVLEDVFTVERVDMDGPIPTLWMKELPTSPLYFTDDDYINLANETED
jgi:hypothetical protein